MARDIRTKAHLQGGEIRTKANFGQTVAITVLPDPYEGATTVTPSDERQTLPTRDKTVATDITVLPAPTETLSTTENGQFTPSDGKVGFSSVTVDVQPDLRPLSVTENGSYQPEGFDGFSQVIVDVPDKYLLSTHVLGEDKLSGTYASYWLRTYMPWCIPWEEDDMNLYMMTFEGNEASQYRANICLLNSFSHQQYVFSRSQTGARVLNLNIGTDGGYDFWATAGTVIKVYKFPPVI